MSISIAPVNRARVTHFVPSFFIIRTNHKKAVAIAVIASALFLSGPLGVLAATTGSISATSPGYISQWSVNNSGLVGGDCSSNYISTGTTNNRSAFTVSLSSVPDGSTITSVAVSTTDRESNGTNGTYRTFARLNGVNTDAGSDLAATNASGCTSRGPQTLNVADTVKVGGGTPTTLEIGVFKTSGDTSSVRIGSISVVITYTLPVGTLRVIKTLVNDGPGNKGVVDFSFSATGPTPVSTIAFEADAQNDISVSPGTYTVTETAAPGYTGTYSNCASVAVANGSTTTCTITNNDDGTSLIKNPSFENGPVNTPLFWVNGAYGVNNTSLTTVTPGRTGGRAGQVSITSYTNGDAKWVSDPVTVSAGQYYTLSDWYKSNVSTEVDLIYTTAGGDVFEQLGVVPASASWTQFSGDFLVPAGVTAVRVAHIISSVGTLTTDDYSLTLGTAPVFSEGFVTLTFDDGWKSFFDNGVPVLNTDGLKATAYLNTDPIVGGFSDYMTASNVASLVSQGYDVGGHTKSHADLTLPGADLTTQVDTNRTYLQGIAAPEAVDTFAYPYGNYNSAVITHLQGDGYLGARTVDQGYNFTNTDKFKLKIQHVTNLTTVAEVKGWIDTAKSEKAWLILMFHKIKPGSDISQCTGDEECTTADFLKQVSDYLVAQNITTPTMHQGLAVMNGGPIPDTIKPVVTPHGNVTVDATSGSGATVTFAVTATDNVDPSPVVTCAPTSGSTFLIGSTTVSCTAIDASGNTSLSPGTFIVAVHDGAPVITRTGNAEVTVEYASTYTDSGATALDAVDGNLTSSIVVTNLVNTAILGDYTVKYNVSDSHGNVATEVTRLVHVVAKAISVTANLGQSKVFGTLDPVFAYTSSPLVGTDSFSGALSRVVGENVGAYAITLGTLSAGSNYSITFVPADFAITKAPTVTAITNSVALGSSTVVGESYTVAWSVIPSSGSASTTGTVTVTVNGGAGCSGAVALGQCSITPSATGLNNLVATYSGDSTYTGSASGEVPHTINKANTSISITNSPELATQSAVNQAYIVKWTVGVSSPGAGTPTGSVTVTGGSECSANVSALECNVTSTIAGVKNLIATYNGDTNFGSSTSSGASHTVVPADQTITFGALVNKATNAVPFAVNATSSSGLPVSFSILSGPATILGNTVTITGAGTVVVRASQAGDANYNPAPNVDQSFLVTVAPEVVIDSAPSAFINTANTSVSFHVNGDYTTLVCTLDTVNFPCTSGVPVSLSLLGEGAHAFVMTATDALANVDTKTVSFTVDLTVPTIVLSTTASNPTNISPVPVTATFSESVTGFDSSDVSVSNGTVGNFSGTGAVYTFDVTPSGDGPFTITVDVASGAATDGALNQNTAATELVVPYDHAAPSLSVNAPTENATVITGTTDTDATVKVTLNAITYDATGEETGNWSQAVPALADGLYPISVSATDVLSNAVVNNSRTLVVDTTAPEITVVGNDPQVLEVGSAYVELGATVSDALDPNLALTISTTTVNTTLLGSYTVTYDAVDAAGNHAIQKTRTVNVVDTTKPVITLLGDNPMNVVITHTYIEPGATVSDNYDSGLVTTIDASAVNTSLLGTYSVLYNVEDSSHNATSTTRTVKVIDSLPPVITLVGSNPLVLHVGDVYTDPGATALDDVDGNITANIIVAGDIVDTATMGAYFVTYNVSDASLNAATEVTRTVNVVPVIGSESVTTPTTNSVTITWTTDHLATSRVIWDTVSHSNASTSEASAPNYGYANSTAESDTAPKVTSHSVTVTGLSASTTYFFRPVSHGSPETVGNEVTSTTQNLPPEVAAATSRGGGGGGGGSVISASLKINNGASQTNTPNVTLSLSAPPMASQMSVSNDQSFSGGWIPLQATYPWVLSSSSGVKTVYVRFAVSSSTIASAQSSIVLSPGSEVGVGQVLGATTFNFTRRLYIGSTGNDVTELQNRLMREGVYTGPITGYFGQLTKAGVQAFQKKYGIDPVGIVGPKTRAILNQGVVSSTPSGQTVSSLADQIQKLLAQVAALQAQLQALKNQ